VTAIPRNVTRGLIARALSRLNLRFPVLFLVLLTVTIADLLIPDVIPFVDEIVLGLLTAIFGLWRKRHEPPSAAPEVRK
jgi:Family of unknown function (DUF6116)